MSLVLASASASRARLLSHVGLAPLIDAAEIDEGIIKAEQRQAGAAAAACALALALAKARSVSPRHPGALVLGADQMLDCDGVWYDKPRDRAAARRQLQALRGRTHRLLGAAAVLRDGVVLWRHVETARLTLRAFSDGFLDDYLARMGDRLLTIVGGYELEGLGLQLMAAVEGDYFSILGLPLLPLLRFLRDEGEVAA